jgi:hypothetical protein
MRPARTSQPEALGANHLRVPTDHPIRPAGAVLVGSDADGRAQLRADGTVYDLSTTNAILQSTL